MPDPSPHPVSPASRADPAGHGVAPPAADAAARGDVARVSTPATPRHLAGQTQQLFTSGPRFKRLIQHYRPYICPFGDLIEQIPQGATVLDVGCGGGMFLGLLASAGRIGRGVGFDTSASAIETARAMAMRLPAEQQVLTFHQLDAAADWPTAPDDGNESGESAASDLTLFDAVSIIDVVHHVPRRHHGDLIRRAARRLRPGGTLLVKDIPPRPIWRATANRLHDLVLARQWVHLPRPGDIRSWADEAGLRLVRRERINMLWYGHEMMVFEKPSDM
jgi:2-polyprenyl-3-methyl-5-hydroxy-6-metoxy-1,4-benzoquinol methylase